MLDPKAACTQIGAVERAIDSHRTAQQSGAPGLVCDALNGLEGAQQHGVWHAFARRYDVHAIPEAIDEINVRMSGRAEHDFRPLRASTGRVCREILGAHVGFGLYDAADAPSVAVVVDQVHADELARDKERVLAGVKRAG